MKSHYHCSQKIKNFPRRNFLASLGAVTTGLILHPPLRAYNLYARPLESIKQEKSQVAVALAKNYERQFIKKRIQFLFESIGGIGDIIKPGDRVAVKINIVAGLKAATHPQSADVRESVWTHPEVVRSVCELLLDHGVNAKNLYIVEALWDEESYNNYGYYDVQQSLGAQFINLDTCEPYPAFIRKSTGNNHFHYREFKVNPIIDEVDVFISIAKMKQHNSAGVSQSVKNLAGIIPNKDYELPDYPGWRSAIHLTGGNQDTFLPRAICDLNMARPIDLSIIDGIKNSIGGEVPWYETYKPTEHHLLLAGKDPIATDSIAALRMGIDPEADTLPKPDGYFCDNFLKLASQKGLGNNKIADIELVGDPTEIIGKSIQESYQAKNQVTLFQNHPNPIHSHTTIQYFLPRKDHVSLKIFSYNGKEIEALVNGTVSSGRHQYYWVVDNIPSGKYLCRLKVGNFSKTRELSVVR